MLWVSDIFLLCDFILDDKKVGRDHEETKSRKRLEPVATVNVLCCLGVLSFLFWPTPKNDQELIKESLFDIVRGVGDQKSKVVLAQIIKSYGRNDPRFFKIATFLLFYLRTRGLISTQWVNYEE